MASSLGRLPTGAAPRSGRRLSEATLASRLGAPSAAATEVAQRLGALPAEPRWVPRPGGEFLLVDRQGKASGWALAPVARLKDGPPDPAATR